MLLLAISGLALGGIMSCQWFRSDDDDDNLPTLAPPAATAVPEDFRLLTVSADDAEFDEVCAWSASGRIHVNLPQAGEYLITAQLALGVWRVVLRSYPADGVLLTIEFEPAAATELFPLIIGAQLRPGQIVPPPSSHTQYVQEADYPPEQIWRVGDRVTLFAWPGGGIGPWDQIFQPHPTTVWPLVTDTRPHACAVPAPAATPTTIPTAPPGAPTTTPTVLPTGMPTTPPTATPTVTPTGMPTVTSTATPTVLPTGMPTTPPTATPTVTPTGMPTVTSTATPTVLPTGMPTAAPTTTPTVTPTGMPTAAPTVAPTPTIAPTGMPTASPTVTPTITPTTTAAPTVTPTSTPTSTPTATATPGPVILYHAGLHDGNLGGRTGADDLCVAAKPASLPASYTNVHAFISVQNGDAIQDLLPWMGDNRPITSVGGTMIFTNGADMLDGDNPPISLLAAGVVPTNTNWWSGSDPIGFYYAGEDECANWTTNDGSGVWRGREGSTVSPPSVNHWLGGGGLWRCNINLYLLCITYE